MAKTKAILFDMGGTLLYPSETDELMRKEYLNRIKILLDANHSEDELYAMLSRRYNAYKEWAEKTSREIPEEDIWTQWMLPDWPEERVRRLAVQLNYWFRAARRLFLVPPDMQLTLNELVRRGYRLGLVSNTTSRTEGIHVLESHGLLPHFETIILSTLCGIRKPDPAIFHLALAELGILPEEAAYIGDRPDRDVAGARQAGIPKTVIIRLVEPFQLGSMPVEMRPDHLILALSELLVIFPPLEPTGGGSQIDG